MVTLAEVNPFFGDTSSVVLNSAGLNLRQGTYHVVDQATGAGADGNLTAVPQGGQAAYETWTTAQTGVGSANVYLQIDPSSQVDTASAGPRTSPRR
ncbi:MAG TPA: hypothetical protein VGZ32_19545 [Actinocrinis sp.]|uniref:hypothetical protein n=1 Tax=Actinocrinis sp. TaxID=1920516 RepID=UPI002DDCD55C|nr:hypothetical protein [Actinocrinis sp.]HEV3172549.1 hypothetical protein [Actinocrinis sp.]